MYEFRFNVTVTAATREQAPKLPDTFRDLNWERLLLEVRNKELNYKSSKIIIF